MATHRTAAAARAGTWTRVVVVAGIGLAALAGGSAALATSGHSTSTSSNQHAKPSRDPLAAALHVTYVTLSVDPATGASTFVTHQAIRGAVAAVSADSISVRSLDGALETFGVTATTREQFPGDTGEGRPGRIARVRPGDRVSVYGTGTGTPVAGHVVDTT